MFNKSNQFTMSREGGCFLLYNYYGYDNMNRDTRFYNTFSAEKCCSNRSVVMFSQCYIQRDYDMAFVIFSSIINALYRIFNNRTRTDICCVAAIRCRTHQTFLNNPSESSLFLGLHLGSLAISLFFLDHQWKLS